MERLGGRRVPARTDRRLTGVPVGAAEAAGTYRRREAGPAVRRSAPDGVDGTPDRDGRPPRDP
ncbi:hypothetical protein GCM10022630_22660 [Thermobifida alba]